MSNLTQQHAALGAARNGHWTLNREAGLNWLALGLLLAAWNAADNNPAPESRRRPETLRGYTYVSVRAVNRVAAEIGD